MVTAQQNMTDHARRVMTWRENLEILPDEDFFRLIHIYLGEIKTPYNKQRLIEQLTALLHNQKNQQTIIALLDQFDCQILTALSFIPGMTQSKLSLFFSGEYTSAQVIMRIMNLRDRLIIYTDCHTDPQQPVILINPVLENTLAPYISIQSVFPTGSCSDVKKKPTPHPYETTASLTAPLLASFIAYLKEHPDLCKSDGMFKKNDCIRLEKIFPGMTEMLQLLFTSFINLSLVKQTEKQTFIDSPRLKSFSVLTPQQQYAFLCAGSACRLSRDILRSQAQLLLNCIASIPADGSSRTALLRMSFLLAANSVTDEKPLQGRFSKILAEAAPSPTETTINFIGEKNDSRQLLFDRIIDAAVSFGLLSCAEDVFTPGPSFDSQQQTDSMAKVFSINAGFTITLMPGLPLAELLPFTDFLSPVQYNTAAEFEITRQSAIRAYDVGFSTADICTPLEKHSLYELPQNLRVTLEDWQNAYQSAEIYKGYFIKLDEQNSVMLEKNPAAACYIKRKLAPGIYFLSVNSDEEAAAFSAAAGFESIGSIKDAAKVPDVIPFPRISDGKNFIPQTQSKPLPEKNTGEKIILSLRKETLALDVPKQQQEGLLQRIDRRLILSPEQLAVSVVHAENLEADGMDFNGKLRLLENAATSGDTVELQISDDQTGRSLSVYSGVPLQVKKNESGAVLIFKLNKTEETRFFSVSHINHVKLMKQL